MPPLARWSRTFLAICFLVRHVAASVNLHGASPWHPKKVRQISFNSNERETPPDKPVASLRVFTWSRLDHVALYIQNDPTLQAHIITYGGVRKVGFWLSGSVRRCGLNFKLLYFALTVDNQGSVRL